MSAATPALNKVGVEPLPPLSLVNKKGQFWKIPDVWRDLFTCCRHGCELERAQVFWVCRNLNCQAVPDGLLLVRMKARAEALAHKPGFLSMFRRIRLRGKFLFRSARADDWRARRLYVDGRGTGHECVREADLGPGH